MYHRFEPRYFLWYILQCNKHEFDTFIYQCIHQVGLHQEVYSVRCTIVSKPSPSLPPPTAPVYSTQQVQEKMKQVSRRQLSERLMECRL